MGTESKRMCYKRQHAKDLVERIYIYICTHTHTCIYVFKKSRRKLTVITVFFWGIETAAKMKMGI